MNTRKNKILIVDDDPSNIQLLEGALKEDYEIHSSLNGFDAIRHVKEQLPDLILLDVMMPDINGFDVCRVIKSDGILSAIPVIFLTAMDTFEGEVEGFESGGIDFLTKPVNFELLKLRVRNHLELKRQNDLIREQRDELARQKVELEAAITRFRRLEGILPICMHCKNIRCDGATWQNLERYIMEHSDALFSHGICPDCLAQHYPEFAGRTKR